MPRAVYGALKGMAKKLTSVGLESGAGSQHHTNLGTCGLCDHPCFSFSFSGKSWAAARTNLEHLFDTDGESQQTGLWLHGPSVPRLQVFTALPASRGSYKGLSCFSSHSSLTAKRRRLTVRGYFEIKENGTDSVGLSSSLICASLKTCL